MAALARGSSRNRNTAADRMVRRCAESSTRDPIRVPGAGESAARALQALARSYNSCHHASPTARAWNVDDLLTLLVSALAQKRVETSHSLWSSRRGDPAKRSEPLLDCQNCTVHESALHARARVHDRADLKSLDTSLIERGQERMCACAVEYRGGDPLEIVRPLHMIARDGQ